MAQVKKLTAAQVAEKLGIEPRTLRKVLRREGMRVGRGKSHELTTQQVSRIRKAISA
jgi:uncharacterized protein YjcR